MGASPAEMGRTTMHDPKATDRAFGSRDEGRLLDVLIRAGLILALVMLCYQIFSPFLVLMVWAWSWPSRCIR
jgi:hypothetical protein